MYGLNLMGFDKEQDSYIKRAGKFMSKDYARTAADFKKIYGKGMDSLDSTLKSMREMYKSASEKIQGYANGPSSDSSYAALGNLLKDVEISAMKAYIGAQQIIYAGMRSK